MVGEDDKRFAITWKIRNFSYCWKTKRLTIESPEFYAENVRRTKWILQISQEDSLLSHFTVLIKRAEEDYGPASVKLNLKICLLSNKGLPLKREWVENTEFSKGTETGFQKLLERAALFATRKDDYLPQDTLTVHCQFWEVYTTTTETEYVFARSQMEFDRKLFLGTICEFSQLNPGESSEVQLEILSSEDETSVFIPDQACLCVMERTDYEEKLNLCILFDDEFGEFFSCKISVMDIEGQKLNCGKFNFRYEEYGPRILQCVLLPTKWDLMAKESLYLPADTLTLHCELIVTTGFVSHLSVTETTDFDEKLKITIVFDHGDGRIFSCKINIHDFEGQKLNSGKFKFRFKEVAPRTLECVLLPTKWDLMDGEFLYLPADTMTLECELIIATGIVSQLMKDTLLREVHRDFDAESSSSSALDDFRNIYNDGFLCDVNLQTGAESFPAHKVILSARSPVFQAMFSNDMKETVTKRVDLPDLDCGTVRQLLVYMYSDAVECLEWDSVRNLYAAADKYAIGSLKTKCSTILKGILMPSQACELLVLADMHRDYDLKKFAQDFISENEECVLGSNSWMELEQKNPQLAIGAMRHLYTCLRARIESMTLSWEEC